VPGAAVPAGWQHAGQPSHAAAPTANAGSEFFLAYQYPPPLWGDKKLYRVYQDADALTFLHLGLFFDGVDFGALARSHTPPDTKLLATGAGLLVAAAESIGARIEEPKLRARIAAVEAMSPRERLLEAAKKPNILAAAGDLSHVRLDPYDGYHGPWASAPDGEIMAWLRFRLQGGRKYALNLRTLEDLQLAVRWLREILGPDGVLVSFRMDAPPAARPRL
jgi:hypothetical protein